MEEASDRPVTTAQALEGCMRRGGAECAYPAELIEECRGGDRRAWARLFMAASPSVYAHALRLSRNREDAEDLTQQVFLRLLKQGADGRVRFHLYDPDRLPLERFLDIVTRRCFLDLARTRGWKVWRDAEDVLTLEASLPARQPEELPIPRADLQRALAELPLRDRKVLEMQATGYRYDEIAASTGLTLGGVSALIARARTRLAARLSDAAV